MARHAADAVANETGQRRFVAGSLGPLPVTASLSPDVNDPSFRAVTFDQIRQAYARPGAGAAGRRRRSLMVETIFDTLNAKAAIAAITELFEKSGKTVPLIISGTVTDRSGRILSGQTVEAFLTSIAHAKPLVVGLNCALGPGEMEPYIEELAHGTSPSTRALIRTPACPIRFRRPVFLRRRKAWRRNCGNGRRNGWLNIVGGCCGTTPDHIRAIAEARARLSAAENAGGRALSRRRRITGRHRGRSTLQLSGLEPLNITPEMGFVVVGERTNITGSPKFSKLILAGDFEAALAVARQQVKGGANILDVNMDEGMIDSEASMTRFLHLIGSEPEISRVPIMIDSSKWSVIEAGLKCVQGKAVVNSISLKNGEEEFLRQAALVRRYGAAVIVMAFDESGQADSLQRRIDVCARAYKLLTERAGHSA